MRVVKRINNNAVLAIDSDGKQLVAMGCGLAHAGVGEDLDLSCVERTFYDVDSRYVDLMRDLPQESISLAAGFADTARSLLPYELSANFDIALADHIAFAIKRAREGIEVSTPLAFDVQQNYPVEFKIGQYAVKKINERLGVRLPPREAIGIALCIVNSTFSMGAAPQEEAVVKEDVIERATKLVEKNLGVTVEREGFNFVRFATHVQYLLDRVLSGNSLDTENSDLYHVLAEGNEKVSACVDKIAELIEDGCGRPVTEEEKLYLILHVNRICQRTDG